jgi:hypothetical protein
MNHPVNCVGCVILPFVLALHVVLKVVRCCCMSYYCFHFVRDLLLEISQCGFSWRFLFCVFCVSWNRSRRDLSCADCDNVLLQGGFDALLRG